jgi:hypothetical protein
VTGMISGVPATADVTVMVPGYDPWLIPPELTVATIVDGVTPDAAESAIQLGDAVTENGSVELPLRFIDWLGGFAPAAVKVKLDGLATMVGSLETTRPTDMTIGELVAFALVMVIVAWYDPSAKPAGLTLAVRVAGVVALELVTASQEPLAVAIEKETGWEEVMFTV